MHRGKVWTLLSVTGHIWKNSQNLSSISFWLSLGQWYVECPKESEFHLSEPLFLEQLNVSNENDYCIGHLCKQEKQANKKKKKKAVTPSKDKQTIAMDKGNIYLWILLTLLCSHYLVADPKLTHADIEIDEAAGELLQEGGPISGSENGLLCNTQNELS